MELSETNENLLGQLAEQLVDARVENDEEALERLVNTASATFGSTCSKADVLNAVNDSLLNANVLSVPYTLSEWRREFIRELTLQLGRFANQFLTSRIRSTFERWSF